MSNEKDDINQQIHDLNLTGTNKETTILEMFHHENERINDDYEYEIEGVESYNDTEDLVNIDQLICAQDFANIDQRIYSQEILTNQDDPSLNPSSRYSILIDEANGTPTGSVNLLQCVKRRPSEDCHLPDLIFTRSFPGQNQQEVINILLKVQDKTDKIWSDVDKRYINITITSKICSQMYGEFKRTFHSYLSKEYSTQAKSVNDARSILKQLSFGTLFLNTKNQILGVQNHHGTSSAPKGHPKIKIDGTLETPWETLLRELFEELLIKLKRGKNKKAINKDNIDQFLALNKDNFLECRVDSRPGTSDGLRLIGLLIVRIDEKKYKFSLKDNKENKACSWLNIDEIIRNKPETGHDIYYTLRPFARYIKDHTMP
jgi:hypothetical protein